MERPAGTSGPAVVLMPGGQAKEPPQRASQMVWKPRLRIWTMAILFGAFALLITAQFIAGRYLYTDGYVDAEQRDLLARSRHAQAVLQQGFAMLTPAADDYGTWDATVEFLDGLQPKYPEINWLAADLQRFGIDAVFIMDLAGKLRLQRGLDGTRQRLKLPTAAELAAVRPGGVLAGEIGGQELQAGYVAIAGTPYMWAASPVSINGSPSTGAVILLRRLDALFIRNLDFILDSQTRFDVVPGRSDAEAGPSVPLQQDELRFTVLSNTVIRGSFVVGLLPDGSRMELSLTTDRPLMVAVTRVSRNFFWASIAGGVVISLLSLVWVQRRLLGPIGEISRRLQVIGTEGGGSVRLPMIGQRDEITGVVLATNRMLDQVESKHAVELARDAAIKASRSKSEFMARMSHEIRTPMNGVLGMTELLESTRLDERQQHYAETIRKSAGSLLKIINDILDFSKIESGKLQLDEALFHLEQVVREITEPLAEMAHAKGVKLVCSLQPESCVAYRGDDMRLRQVLVNLLGNAIKFTERGQVILRVTEQAGGDAARPLLCFEVEDTGIGIRPESLETIFESFTQEDGSTTRKYGGTGLGLAICKQLVELMGGNIGVRSTLAQGSTFWFTIPLTRESTSGAEHRPEVPSRHRIPFTPRQLRQVLVEHAPKAGGPGAAPTEARGAGHAVLDTRALEQIRALQQPGSSDLLDKIIALYLNNSQSLMDKIRLTLNAGDANGLREAAHALRSSSGNVGAIGLVDIAKRLEMLGRQGNLDEAGPLIEQLFQEHERVISALQAERKAA